MLASGLADGVLDTLDVAVVTTARPPVNAMSRAFMAELAAPLDEGLAEEARRYARDGIRAFPDKRPARFRGR